MKRILIAFLCIILSCTFVFGATEIADHNVTLKARIEPGSIFEEIEELPGTINVDGLMIQLGYSFDNYTMGADYNEGDITGLTPETSEGQPVNEIAVDIAGNNPNLNDYIKFYIAAAAQTDDAVTANVTITAGSWKWTKTDESTEGSQSDVAITLANEAYANAEDTSSDYHVTTTVSPSGEPSDSSATFTISHPASANSLDYKFVGSSTADWVTSAEADTAYLAGDYAADITITVEKAEV